MRKKICLFAFYFLNLRAQIIENTVLKYVKKGCLYYNYDCTDAAFFCPSRMRRKRGEEGI